MDPGAHPNLCSPLATGEEEKGSKRRFEVQQAVGKKDRKGGPLVRKTGLRFVLLKRPGGRYP